MLVNFRETVLLPGRRFALMFRLPLLVGHAIDLLARLVAADRKPARLGLFLVPVGQAIAAEAREIHEIDVLDIAPFAQMPDEAAEGGCFEFYFALLVCCHGMPHPGGSRC